MIFPKKIQHLNKTIQKNNHPKIPSSNLLQRTNKNKNVSRTTKTHRPLRKSHRIRPSRTRHRPQHRNSRSHEHPTSIVIFPQLPLRYRVLQTAPQIFRPQNSQTNPYSLINLCKKLSNPLPPLYKQQKFNAFNLTTSKT